MQGQRGLSTNSSEYNAQDFMISQMLGRIATAEPVRVVAVSGSGVSPVGFVDVQPLINLVTGEQKAQEQSVLFKLPYLRIQGGKNALVIDPQPGDIGLAVYAMRDTESLKESRGKDGNVNPGSARAMSKGDGFYLGGFLNAAPERYVLVDDEGVTIEGVAKLTMHGETSVLTAENGLTINADVRINGSLTWTGTAQGDGGPVPAYPDNHSNGGVLCLIFSTSRLQDRCPAANSSDKPHGSFSKCREPQTQHSLPQ